MTLGAALVTKRGEDHAFLRIILALSSMLSLFQGINHY